MAKNESGSLKLPPGFPQLPSRATTPGLQIGRTLFHSDALILVVTSKCRDNICQDKSAVIARFLPAESHIFGKTPATSAIGLKNVPVGASNVVSPRESEQAGGSIDGLRRAFQLEKGADWCLIQVQVEAGKAESGAVFLVAESRLETEGAEYRMPSLGRSNPKLAFEFFLVARALRSWGWAFRRDDRVALASRKDAGWRWHLNTNPKQAARATEVALGRVEKGVFLEHTALAGRAEPPNLRDQRRDIANAELDLDLTNRGAMRHDRV